jgi:hypothetical protein
MKPFSSCLLNVFALDFIAVAKSFFIAFLVPYVIWIHETYCHLLVTRHSAWTELLNLMNVYDL